MSASLSQESEYVAHLLNLIINPRICPRVKAGARAEIMRLGGWLW
jgi:hypothetical protein